MAVFQRHGSVWDFFNLYIKKSPNFRLMKYTSKLIEEAVESLSLLPGIGRKSALRLALFLAQQDPQKAKQIGKSLIQMVDHLKQCKQCSAYSDDVICEICANPTRDQTTICVVESIRDLLAIEETMQYKGLYHVLGGLISPLDGIGPEHLTIAGLINRIKNGPIKELIMALRPCIEGDTTIYYVSKLVDSQEVKISLIARGVSFGAELEFADEMTISRSIATRSPYVLHDKSVV